MKVQSGVLTISILLFLSTYSFCADTTKIIYNDFSDLSLWRLNNKSAGATNADQKKVLRLTPNKMTQSGSAFMKDPIILISDKGFKASFSAFFSFQITNTGGLDEGSGAGADGIVFVVQTVANNVGSNGGGLGYRNIKRSLGIEFDTWENSDDSTHDPDGNHIGIDTNGNTISVKTLSEKALFNNGAIWYAWIDYDGDNQMLYIRYDSTNTRPANSKLSYKVNLPSLLVQENAYVGFTSATGASYNTHDILTFNFINKFQPFTYDLSLSVNPDSVVKVHDSLYLRATIHDMNNLVQPDSAKKTEWSIIDPDGNPSDILKANTGSEVLLVPQVAFTNIKIEGKASVNGQVLTDTITVRVTSGDPFRLSIESNRVTNDTSLLRHSHPVDVVTLANLSDIASVFAVVRDQWGNYCRLADSLSTNWQILSGKDFISVKGVSRAMYNGQITRTGPSGDALVEASESGLIKDSVQVKTTGLFISKIVVRDHSTGKTVDSLLTKIGQTRVLDVYGLITGADSLNANAWVLVNANWNLSESIQSVKTAPVQGSNSWDYIPLTFGNGTITIKSTQYPLTNVITVPVTILSDVSPFLIRAVFTPSSGPDNAGLLQLYFSEDVDVKMLYELLPEKTMKFFSSEGRSSVQVLGGSVFTNFSTEQYAKTITIKMASGGKTIIPDRDSIQLIKGTVNRQGVPPDEKSAKKVPVEILNGVISVSTSTNPVNLSRDIQSVLNAKTLLFYSNIIKGNTIGVIVAVSSSIPLKQIDDSYGTAEIFDAVGNLVASQLHIELANSENRTEYGFFWDGKNRYHRVVGGGTYLLKIHTMDEKGKAHLLTTKIGVSNSNKE